MLSLRNQPISRTLFRREVLALLLGTVSCIPAIGDESDSQQRPVFSTTTLKIRSATRTWTDEGRPVAFEPSLRFRPPTTGASSKPTDETNTTKALPIAAKADEADVWMTNDNWVARDAVNLKQALRDPLPPATVVVPREQPGVQKPTTAAPKITTAPAPRETQPSTRPVLKSTPQAPNQEKVLSATLMPPKKAEVATSPQNNQAGDLDHGPLQLVAPSELNDLKSLNAPTPNRSTHVSDEPNDEAWAGDLPSFESAPTTETAIESMLSAGDVEPSLNSPRGEYAPTDDHLRDRQGTAIEQDSDPKLLDFDNDMESLQEPANHEKESNSTRHNIEYRRLKIDRDGSALDENANRNLNTQRPAHESNSLRDPEGDTESLHQLLEESTPELEEDETKRLQVIPIAQPRSTEQSAPLGTLDYTGRPAVSVQANTAVRRMQSMMRSCLSFYHGTPDEATGRSNWGMMHQIMVYGVDTNIAAGRNTHNAIAWIAGNNACRGQRILTTGARGIAAKSGVGLQGHQGQLLAVLSLSEVPENYPLYVGTQRFYVRDLVREEMAICKSGEELTFTLIGLSHYLDTDHQWRSADGQIWDFERLIREELSQPIVGAACGGTHRLMGFAHALRKRRAEGKEISGQWLRAEKFLDDFVTYTYQLQNRDGSMSTNWFEGREDNGDLDRKVQTTGHMVEWLLTYTPDEDIQNPQMVAAIQFLLNAMNSDRKHEWQIGPKGHALRSLAMYYERVYQSGQAWSRSPATARSSGSVRR